MYYPLPFNFFYTIQLERYTLIHLKILDIYDLETYYCKNTLRLEK